MTDCHGEGGGGGRGKEDVNTFTKSFVGFLS